MSLDEIRKIVEAESKADSDRANAAEEAKRLFAEAEKRGAGARDTILAAAQAKRRQILARAESAAKSDLEAQSAATEKECAELREKALGRLDKAVAIITEKVVS